MSEGKTADRLLDPINLYRCVAVLLVFSLHACVFNGKAFTCPDMLKESSLAFLFWTPAWGGVYFFWLLSGYLAGKGYVDGRYGTSLSETWRYYKKKLMNVYVPTMCFNVAVGIMSFPDFFPQNWNALKQMLTCTYHGAPGVNGIGATWFVFTLMWFYLFTPPFCKWMNKIGSRRKIKYLLILMLLGEAAYRVVARHYGLDWGTMVYSAPLANIDMYFCGVCLAYLLKDADSRETTARVSKALFVPCFLGYIALSCWMLAYNKHIGTLQYYMPTGYLLLGLWFLTVFRSKMPLRRFGGGTIVLLIDWFSGISFEFYLFHSLVLDRISHLIGGPTAVLQHFKLLFFTIVLTVFLSIGYHRIFGRKPYREKIAS